MHAELSDAARAKLEELQTYLKESGIRDIKFFKGEKWNEISIEERANEIIRVLEAMKNGDFEEFDGLGDSVCTSEQV